MAARAARGRRGRLYGAGIAVFILVAGVIQAQTPPQPRWSAPWPPALEIAGAAAADPALRGYLAADRQWLAAQPPHLLSAPVAWGDAAAGDERLVQWLQLSARHTAPGAAAPPDSADHSPEAVAGRRDLLSLLRDRWLARGYLAASVRLGGSAEAAAERPVARVLIEPGPRHHWRELTVTGDDFPGRQAILDLWLPRLGEVFLPEAYRAAAAGVVRGCAEQGHPFAIWLTRSLRSDPVAAEVAVTAVLAPGPRMVIGPQSSNLPAGRGEAFLIRAAGLSSGQPYRETALRRGRERLLARDLYLTVGEPLVHLTAAGDTAGVIWQVEPLSRPNRLAVVVGLAQRERQGTRLSGQVDLNLPNLAGTGRRLRAGWQDDGQARSRFGFSYLEPLILGTPLDTELELANEVQDLAYTLFRLDNRWRLPVVGFWGLELGLGWDRTTYPAGEIQSARRLRARAGLLRLRGDLARSGWSGSFAVESAHRSTILRAAAEAETTGTAAGGQLGRQDRQRLLEMDLAGELWLRTELSLAGRASFRQIDADERPLPLPELYRFGGATSLRGYRQDEFAGQKAAWGAVEVRLGRARRSRVYSFFDVGYFERTTRAAAAGGGLTTGSDTLVGFGLGLLTTAALGQVNLAVGFPGNVDFQTAMLHVSLLGNF